MFYLASKHLGNLKPLKSNVEDDKLCVICVNSIKNTLIYPCGHMCLCEECSKNPMLKKCPMCRGQVLNKVKVYC